MTFDIQAARDAGYDDEEIIQFINRKTGKDFNVKEAREAGYDNQQIMDYLAESPETSERAKAKRLPGGSLISTAVAGARAAYWPVDLITEILKYAAIGGVSAPPIEEYDTDLDTIAELQGLTREELAPKLTFEQKEELARPFTDPIYKYAPTPHNILQKIQDITGLPLLPETPLEHILSVPAAIKGLGGSGKAMVGGTGTALGALGLGVEPKTAAEIGEVAGLTPSAIKSLYSLLKEGFPKLFNRMASIFKRGGKAAQTAEASGESIANILKNTEEGQALLKELGAVEGSEYEIGEMLGKEMEAEIGKQVPTEAKVAELGKELPVPAEGKPLKGRVALEEGGLTSENIPQRIKDVELAPKEVRKIDRVGRQISPYNIKSPTNFGRQAQNSLRTAEQETKTALDKQFAAVEKEQSQLTPTTSNLNKFKDFLKKELDFVNSKYEPSTAEKSLRTTIESILEGLSTEVPTNNRLINQLRSTRTKMYTDLAEKQGKATFAKLEAEMLELITDTAAQNEKAARNFDQANRAFEDYVDKFKNPTVRSITNEKNKDYLGVYDKLTNDKSFRLARGALSKTGATRQLGNAAKRDLVEKELENILYKKEGGRVVEKKSFSESDHRNIDKFIDKNRDILTSKEISEINNAIYRQPKSPLQSRVDRGDKIARNIANQMPSKNFTPEQIMKKFDSVSGIREIDELLSKSNQGRQLMEQARKWKVKDIMYGGKRSRPTFADMHKTLDKQKNADLVRELIGEKDFNRLDGTINKIVETQNKLADAEKLKTMNEKEKEALTSTLKSIAKDLLYFKGVKTLTGIWLPTNSIKSALRLSAKVPKAVFKKTRKPPLGEEIADFMKM